MSKKLPPAFFPFFLLLVFVAAQTARGEPETFSATEGDVIVRNPEPLAIRKLPLARGGRKATPKKKASVKKASATPVAPAKSAAAASAEAKAQAAPKARKSTAAPARKQMAGVAAPARALELPSETRSSVQPEKAELGEFFPVPKDQVQPIGRRLSLVEEIMTRHGRAYDYRAHTVQELQDILAQLETEAARAAATEVEAPRELKVSPGMGGDTSAPQAPDAIPADFDDAVLPPPPGV
jgi:guanyl-specific ribonuclease Sa